MSKRRQDVLVATTVAAALIVAGVAGPAGSIGGSGRL